MAKYRSILALAAAASLFTAAPALATPKPPRLKLVAPTSKRVKPLAHMSSASLAWNATLDCYPPGGSVTGSNATSFSLNWRTTDGRTYPAYHQIVYEDHMGGVTYWVTQDGRRSTTFSSGPLYGLFHVDPIGIQELRQSGYFDPTGLNAVSSQSDWTATFPWRLSERNLVRAWVYFWVYTPERGWESLGWVLARTVHDTVNNPGYCSM